MSFRASAPELSDEAQRHRQVMQALTGLLLGMFVSMLAGTVVGTSLPRIINELGGDQAAFTWVITANLLATTVATPIWGKFADMFSRKLLMQLAISGFTLASIGAGFATGTGDLIFWRVLQGLAGGGMAALSQVIMADILSPRERGRYMGWFGAVMATATVGGPLIGGFITDGIGWRWNFWILAPFTVITLITLQRTLHLAHQKRENVKVDYAGAVFLSGGAATFLLWVSFGGKQFEWLSWESAALLGASLVLIAITLLIERKVAEPIMPLSLFKNRTFTLATIASLGVGLTMFGATVYLGQYMQLARGASPSEAGLMTLPLVAALLISSTVIGQIISRNGKWKAWVVAGTTAVAVGLALLGTIHFDTPYWLLVIYMFILGAGIGACMQNMVLAVQNSIDPRQLGVASSGVTFFRSLGGTAGVAALGAVLGNRILALMTEKAADLQDAIAHLGEAGKDIATSLASGVLPNVRELPDSVRVIVESAYGDAVATVFLVAAPLAIISIIAAAFMPNSTLGTKNNQERLAELKADNA